MKKFNKPGLSLITFFLLAFSIISGRFLLPRFETHDFLAIISWDVFGYYLYLPATFIYHDLGIKDFSWLQHILDVYNPTIGFYQAYMGPVGDYVLKYPMGLAVLYSPFFFIGHLSASLFHFPADGFSLPYQVAIAMGSLTYAILGIWIFRSILIHFFSETVSSLTMILIVSGTNYFQLTAYDGLMPHNVLFTLYALIVWLTIRWHEEQRWKFAFFLGLTIGLAILTRPTSAVIVLVPLLWGIHDKETLKNKWDLVRRRSGQLIAMIVLLCIPPFFQMLYWKIHAGSFFYYSYESTERLRWIAPYLWQVLFSFKKGWLVYAPMMIFPIIGLYFLAEKNKSIFYSVFGFFLLNLAVIASWPTWWYGGSLGQRALMESYVVLALPLGCFIQWLFTKKLYFKIPIYLIFTFFITLNLFQTWQYMNFIFDPSNMTKEYYCAIFGKTTVTEETKLLIEGYEVSPGSIMKNEENFNIKVLAFYDFENKDFPYLGNLESGMVRNGKYSFRMDTNMQFSPGIRIRYADLTQKLKTGIRITAWIYSKEPFADNPGSLVVTSNHAGLNYRYESILFEKENMKPGEWNKVVLHYLTPESPDPNDILQVYVWYRGRQVMYIDDLKIELFEPKQ